jgi:hypothetical protein
LADLTFACVGGDTPADNVKVTHINTGFDLPQPTGTTPSAYAPFFILIPGPRNRHRNPQITLKQSPYRSFTRKRQEEVWRKVDVGWGGGGAGDV